MATAAYSIICTIFNIFSAYAVFRLLKVFLGEPVCSSRILLKRYIVYFLANIVTFLAFGGEIINLAVKILGLSYLTESYEAARKKKCAAVAFVCICVIGVESLVALSAGHKILFLYESDYYRLLAGTASIPLFTFMAALLLERFDGLRQEAEFRLMHLLCIVLVPTESVFDILKMFRMKNLNPMEMIGSILLELAINFSVFYLYDALAKSMRLKAGNQMMLMEADAYRRESNLIAASSESVRLMKHDMENHLSALQILLIEGQYREALKYMEDMSGKINSKEEYARTGNVAVDGILNFKIENARQKHIRVKTELSLPPDIQIREFDLVTILANAMDNAIEAAGEVEEEFREICIVMEYRKGRLLLETNNTCRGKLCYRSDGALESTKEDNIHHGKGLRNIRISVERYNGTMDTWLEKDRFHLFILMFAGGIKRKQEIPRRKKTAEEKPLVHDKKPLVCDRDDHNTYFYDNIHNTDH